MIEIPFETNQGYFAMTTIHKIYFQTFTSGTINRNIKKKKSGNWESFYLQLLMSPHFTKVHLNICSKMVCAYPRSANSMNWLLMASHRVSTMIHLIVEVRKSCLPKQGHVLIHYTFCFMFTGAYRTYTLPPLIIWQQSLVLWKWLSKWWILCTVLVVGLLHKRKLSSGLNSGNKVNGKNTARGPLARSVWAPICAKDVVTERYCFREEVNKFSSFQMAAWEYGSWEHKFTSGNKGSRYLILHLMLSRLGQH